MAMKKGVGALDDIVPKTAAGGAGKGCRF